MNKTYSWLVLIAICAVTLALAFLAGVWYKTDAVDKETNDSSTPTPSTLVSRTPTPIPSPKATLHTVHLTQQGPSPKTLTIKIGDAVLFINETNHLIWPISSVCSGFNAYRGLNNGESYTLTFSAPANCTYYNSLNSYNTTDSGTITIQ